MFRRLLTPAGYFACLFLLSAWDGADAPVTEDEPFARRWVYASETSAVVYWQLGDIETDGVSFVEYGTTEEYGERTEVTVVSRWSHFHRLRDLRKDTVYHYRMVVATDSTRYTSQDRTFSTRCRFPRSFSRRFANCVSGNFVDRSFRSHGCIGAGTERGKGVGFGHG